MSGEKSPPAKQSETDTEDNAKTAGAEDTNQTDPPREPTSETDVSEETDASEDDETTSEPKGSDDASDVGESDEADAPDDTSDESEKADAEDVSDDAEDDTSDVAEDEKEQAFFEGEGVEGEEIEEIDLTPIPALQDEPLWGSTHGPVVPPEWEFALPLAVIVVSLLVMSTFWDDVRYFFAPRNAIELGSAREGCTKAMYAKMKHNRIATIKKVYAQPGMTAIARVRFQKQNYIVAMGCNLLLVMNRERFKRVAESYFGATGRLMRSDLTPATRSLQKYYGTSGILGFGKGTYLMYVDEHPNHQWWLVVIYLILGGLVLYNAWRLANVVWHNHIKATEGE